MTYHIRAKLQRLGGISHGCKDRGEWRKPKALCGAPVTEYDASFAGGWAVLWRHPEHGVMEPCPECVRLRADILTNRKAPVE